MEDLLQEEGQEITYLYTVACHEDELELCRMEMRTMLGSEPVEGGVVSGIDISPSRFLSSNIKSRFVTKEQISQVLPSRLVPLNLMG